MKVLEVASYAHTTGYRLQQELGCEVTLFDISGKALQLGRRTAAAADLVACPQLVAGDFHALPFEANSFDMVYISSAMHHTWEYRDGYLRTPTRPGARQFAHVAQRTLPSAMLLLWVPDEPAGKLCEI